MTTKRLYSTNYDYIKYENIIKIKFITKIHLKLGLSIQLLGVYRHHILGCFNKPNIVRKQLLFKYELF